MGWVSRVLVKVPHAIKKMSTRPIAVAVPVVPTDATDCTGDRAHCSNPLRHDIGALQLAHIAGLVAALLLAAAIELHREGRLQRHEEHDGERIRGPQTLPMTFSYLDLDFLPWSREDPSHGLV